MVKIVDVIGKKSGILHADGLKLYSTLIAELVNSSKIEVSFAGLEHCTTAFLNASIGKLIMNKPDVVHQLVYLETQKDILMEKIKNVTKNALNKGLRETHDDSVRHYFEA